MMQPFRFRPLLVWAAQWSMGQPVEGVEPYHIKDSIQDKWVGRFLIEDSRGRVEQLFYLQQGDWLVKDQDNLYHGVTDREFQKRYSAVLSGDESASVIEAPDVGVGIEGTHSGGREHLAGVSKSLFR